MSSADKTAMEAQPDTFGYWKVVERGVALMTGLDSAQAAGWWIQSETNRRHNARRQGILGAP